MGLKEYIRRLLCDQDIVDSKRKEKEPAENIFCDCGELCSLIRNVHDFARKNDNTNNPRIHDLLRRWHSIATGMEAAGPSSLSAYRECLIHCSGELNINLTRIVSHAMGVASCSPEDRPWPKMTEDELERGFDDPKDTLVKKINDWLRLPTP